MSVRELLDFCPPPAGAECDFDWVGLEVGIGKPLPDDYRKILSAYGDGQFAQFIFIYLPESETPTARIGDMGRDLVNVMRSQQEGVNAIHFPYGVDEILLCGVTDNGDHVWWLMNSEDANSWEILVSESKFTDWYHFRGGLAIFLHEVLSGLVTVPLFPEGLLSSSPCFVPYSE
jgi:hypothetical protein